MGDNFVDKENAKLPESNNAAKVSRGAMQAIGGVLPIAGGVFSAIAGAWSEHEQKKVNRFFEHWVRMLQDELKEKEETIIEIMARLDLQDEAISERVESKSYQSLVKKTFREWSCAESEEKREYIRNILANAAHCQVSSDDVVRMFIDWMACPRISVHLVKRIPLVSHTPSDSHIPASSGGVWDCKTAQYN